MFQAAGFACRFVRPNELYRYEANTPGGVVQHPLQLVPFAHRALRAQSRDRPPGLATPTR